MPQRVSTKRKVVAKRARPTAKTIRLGAFDVVVDFIFDRGLFFISVKNTTDKPVFNIRSVFNKKIFGVPDDKRPGQRINVATLPMFKNISFLAPHRELKTFLDTSHSYFKRKQPAKITVRYTYQNSRGFNFVNSVVHDLNIYKQMSYIKRLNPAFTNYTKEKPKAKET